MPLHLPTFLTRTGSAIVFALIMLVGLLWNVTAFTVLIVLIQFLCLREFFRLMPKIFPDSHRVVIVEILVHLLGIFVLVLACTTTDAGEEFSMSRLAPILSISFFPVLILLIATLSKHGSLHSGFQAIVAMAYIMLPVLMLFILRNISLVIPLGLILMIWINDTMAYIVGSFIGKTPFSKISPKKTWEGTIGGAILTIIGAAVWGYYAPYYQMIDWMALAFCASVAGTFGDLLESKLKRLADVKDSGRIMPGHGGALDRFDSLLVATPFAFAYAYVFMPVLPVAIF
jgi:phosphatidate cytidylyltransferase